MNSTQQIKIIVATHKKYRMPKDEMYLTVQVGSENSKPLGYQPDNLGENISKKRPNYCELTALYWAWKNVNADYIGLVHYRRYFKSVNKNDDKFEMILSNNEARILLEEKPIILPKKRKYYIETVYNHYSHTFYSRDLDSTRKVLDELYPEYVEAFDKVMKKRSIHIFNMFIMRKDLLNEYCKWLFHILENVEKELDITMYNDFEARVFGRISECLLDVWIETNHLDYKEVPVLFMENINWNKKVQAFLKAKFLGEKYGASF